ncbi:MAG: MarR family transcriptional regulator, partial [Spirochaetia bacterium]
LAQKEGLSITEMALLWKAHHTGACRATVLADELGVPPSTLTGMYDRLVEGGWLERDRDPDDRRAVVMRGTEKLGALVRTLKHDSSRALEKAFHSLPQNTRERLGGDLAAVLECLEQEESVQ